MSSHSKTKTALGFISAVFLSSCLVSEEPVLDASNGRATPLKDGAYLSCSLEEDADASDCSAFVISHDETGLYSIATDDDANFEWRFRRIARRGYAMQSREDEDEYAYYYAKGLKSGMKLTFMQCDSLPEGLREMLIQGGDLETEDEDFDTCNVATLKGLVEPAKAYHRGRVEDEEAIVVILTPAAPTEIE